MIELSVPTLQLDPFGYARVTTGYSTFSLTPFTTIAPIPTNNIVTTEEEPAYGVTPPVGYGSLPLVRHLEQTYQFVSNEVSYPGYSQKFSAITFMVAQPGNVYLLNLFCNWFDAGPAAPTLYLFTNTSGTTNATGDSISVSPNVITYASADNASGFSLYELVGTTNPQASYTLSTYITIKTNEPGNRPVLYLCWGTPAGIGQPTGIIYTANLMVAFCAKVTAGV